MHVRLSTRRRFLSHSTDGILTENPPTGCPTVVGSCMVGFASRLVCVSKPSGIADSTGACDTGPTGVQTRGTIMHNAKPLSRVVQLTAPPSPLLTCTTGQEAPMGDHRMPWYPSPSSSWGDLQTLGYCKDLASAHIDDRGALQACWGLLDLNG
jgi:hypothetical protein